MARVGENRHTLDLLHSVRWHPTSSVNIAMANVALTSTIIFLRLTNFVNFGPVTSGSFGDFAGGCMGTHRPKCTLHWFLKVTDRVMALA